MFSFYFVVKTLRYTACYILYILTIWTLWKTKTSHDINLCVEACRSQTCWNSNQADIRKYVIYVALKVLWVWKNFNSQNWIFLRWNCFTFSKKYQWPNFIKTTVNDTTTQNHQFVFTVCYKVECYIKKTKSTCLLWKIRELVLSCSKPRKLCQPNKPNSNRCSKNIQSDQYELAFIRYLFTAGLVSFMHKLWENAKQKWFPVPNMGIQTESLSNSEQFLKTFSNSSFSLALLTAGQLIETKTKSQFQFWSFFSTGLAKEFSGSNIMWLWVRKK